MTKHMEERDNRIYLDDADVYMRETASIGYDKIGYYIYRLIS